MGLNRDLVKSVLSTVYCNVVLRPEKTNLSFFQKKRCNIFLNKKFPIVPRLYFTDFFTLNIVLL